MNCRNCGAASWVRGHCDYCGTQRDGRNPDYDCIAVTYMNGLIDETQFHELAAKVLGLRAGDGVVIPKDVDIKFISSRRGTSPVGM